MAEGRPAQKGPRVAKMSYILKIFENFSLPKDEKTEKKRWNFDNIFRQLLLSFCFAVVVSAAESSLIL